MKDIEHFDNKPKPHSLACRVVDFFVQRYKAQRSPLPGTLPGAESFNKAWQEGGLELALGGLKGQFYELFPHKPQIFGRTLATIAGSLLWGVGVTAIALPLLTYGWDNRVSVGYLGEQPTWDKQTRTRQTMSGMEAQAARGDYERRGGGGCSADAYASRVQIRGLFGRKSAQRMNKRYDRYSER